MRALWLPDVLRDAALRVVEQPGWQTRGKELDAVEGVVCHHTASPAGSTLATNLAVVTNGTALSPGPIAQILLWRDGTCFIVAAGKANHAGAGGPWGWLPLSPPGQLSIANARTIGIEAVNDGVGEPWAPVMVEAYLDAVAAILAHIGQPADRALTHHEWAPTRKIDPAGPTSGIVAILPKSQTWDGNAWRVLVAEHLAPTPQPPQPEVPPVPPRPTEGLMFTILQINGHPEALGGNMDGNGIAANVVWLNPGRYADCIAAGAPIVTINDTDLRNVDLLGPVPPSFKGGTYFANEIGG